MAKYSTKDDKYFALIQNALSVCRDYKPKFGKSAKSGLSLGEFQGVYQNDPFYA